MSAVNGDGVAPQSSQLPLTNRRNEPLSDEEDPKEKSNRLSMSAVNGDGVAPQSSQLPLTIRRNEPSSNVEDSKDKSNGLSMSAVNGDGVAPQSSQLPLTNRRNESSSDVVDTKKKSNRGQKKRAACKKSVLCVAGGATLVIIVALGIGIGVGLSSGGNSNGGASVGTAATTTTETTPTTAATTTTETTTTTATTTTTVTPTTTGPKINCSVDADCSGCHHIWKNVCIRPICMCEDGNKHRSMPPGSTEELVPGEYWYTYDVSTNCDLKIYFGISKRCYEARDFCVGNGSHLAYFKNAHAYEYFNNFAKSHIEVFNVEWYWIGGQRNETLKTYQWLDGSLIIDAEWAPGQPAYASECVGLWKANGVTYQLDDLYSIADMNIICGQCY